MREFAQVLGFTACILFLILVSLVVFLYVSPIIYYYHNVWAAYWSVPKEDYKTGFWNCYPQSSLLLPGTPS